MTSVLDFMGYNKGNRRGSRCIFPSLSMTFLGVSCFHLLLPLLLGIVCFPSPNQPKLLFGASAPVVAKAVQILVSDPHQPFHAPANSTFLSLLEAERISKGQGSSRWGGGWVGEGWNLLSLPVWIFSQEFIDLLSPQ